MPPLTSVRDRHELAIRVVGGLFVAAPAVGEAWTALSADRTLPLALLLVAGIAAQLVAGLILWYRERIRLETLTALVIGSPLFVAGTVLLTGAAELSLFFVWCAAAAALILRRREVSAFGLACGVAVTLLLLHGADRDAAGASLLLSSSSAVVIGILIRATVSAARMQERTIRRAFDAAFTGMALTSADGQYLDVNSRLATMLGRTREALLELGPVAATHPEDRQPFDELTARAIAAGHEGFTLEKRYLRPDGTTVWARVVSTLISDDAGRPSCFFSQVEDITTEHEQRERMRAKARETDALRTLSAALERGDGLELHGQPIVDLTARTAVWHELLLRLRSDEGLLTPAGFLPAAERYGVINDVDAWVARQAAAHAAAGRRVSINLSARSLSDHFMPARIEGILTAAGADPGRVMIEITETALADDLDHSIRFVEKLRAIGCTVALDDFGTGYATLQMLKVLPVNCLKIDKRFIQDLATSKESQSVLDALAMISSRLGHTLIAEGIEDEQTLGLVRELGIKLVQGFLFGRPRVDWASSAATPARLRDCRARSSR